MAERRMFAKTIIDSDAFLDMPITSQLLYFHLAMRADDEGFINKPKSIMKMVGAKDDDMMILFNKKFVIPFESGIVVIKHWKIHNYIQKDRISTTKYQEEKAMLELDENNAYRMTVSKMDTKCEQSVSKMDTKCEQSVSKMDTPCIQSVSKMDTQYSIGKDSIGKNNNSVVRFAPPTPEEVSAYCLEKGYNIDAERFVNFYEAKGWMIGKNKMKDWKAAVRTWVSKDRKEPQREEPQENWKETMGGIQDEYGSWDDIRNALFGDDDK